MERLDADAAGSRPSVSVVIPTYNDATMLATCLRTLWETVPGR
ncbi:MAG: glycosyltransferase [Chloroflexota bacterium]